MPGFEWRTCGYRWDGSRFTWFSETVGMRKQQIKNLEKRLLTDLELSGWVVRRGVEIFKEMKREMAAKRNSREAKVAQIEKEIQRIEKAMEAIDTIKLRLLLNELAGL